MKDWQKRDIYNTLETNAVVKKTKKYDMTHGGRFRTDENYYFGGYRIELKQYTPSLKNNPLGFIRVFQVWQYHHNILVDSWDESRTDNDDAYDLYLAVKNKYAGKPFINPYESNTR